MRKFIILLFFCLPVHTAPASNNQYLADSLNNASFQLRNTDREKALLLAKKALQESRKLSYRDGIHQAYLNLGISHIEARKLDSAYYFLKMAEEHFSKADRAEQHGMACFQLARMYERLRDFERAEAFYWQALELFGRSGNHLFESYSFNGLGVLNGRQSNYLKALDYFKKSYDIKFSNGIVDTNKELNNIATVYRHMGQYDEAVKFGKQALRLVEELKDSVGISEVLDTIGDILEDSGQPDSALWYYNRSYEIARETGHLVRMMSVLHELGILYRKSGKSQEAIRNFNRILTTPGISEELKEDAWMELAAIYLGLGLPDSAIYFSEKALESAGTTRRLECFIASTGHLQQAHKLQGDASKALYYSELQSRYRDTLDMENKAEQFSDLRVQLETLEQEKSIAVLEKQAEINSLERNRLVILIVSIIVFFVLLFALAWVAFKNRRKIDQLEKLHLKNEIEKNRSELYQQTLHMVHINNTYKEVEQELDKLREIENTRELRRIFQKINVSKLLEKDWENFNRYFGNVHVDFYNTLDALNPHLTQHEKRLCALIKVNLTTREIATILNVEPKSIRMARYRVKKKLNLAEETDLDKFFQTH